MKLALERGVPIVPVVAIGGQETALFVTRGERAARATGWAEADPHHAAGPGAAVRDQPDGAAHASLPPKITIEVLPPIDLEERFGPNLNHDRIYEQVTAQMQRTLSKPGGADGARGRLDLVARAASCR